jgi:hypothetical protein
VRCFVISPIGQPGSAIREHADDVFECIIRPAFKEAAVEGRRADHIKDVGRITKQMYNDILSADFCIAVLHGHNPNVFYEVAVAHSAGVPVILLSEKGNDPPFDLKDERLLHYDLGPRPIYRGDNIHALVTMMESVRRLQGSRVVPFDHSLRPLNASADDQLYSLVNETNASAKFWLDLVGNTRKRLFIAGLGFIGWRGIPGMKEALSTVGASGCEVRVMTMDATNAAFSAMLNPEVTTLDYASQAARITEARNWFRNSLGEGQNVEVRAIVQGTLFQQIIIRDDEALISPYLYSANTGFSPCIKIKEGGPGFLAYLGEFEQIWRANSTMQLNTEARTKTPVRRRNRSSENARTK